jgi:WD40 repeat protein
LHCCEISSDGHYYVFAGDKGHLKFGALSKGNPTDLEVGHMGAHKNRVFCLKWNPFDPNMFFSGGWDKTVFVWDIRTKTAVDKIFGVYMGGNAIDINKNQEILLGNNTNEMPLRIYDMKTSRARLLDWRIVT